MLEGNIKNIEMKILPYFEEKRKGRLILMDKVIRRSMFIPQDLDDRLNEMIKRYSYQYRSDLYQELIELGILKYNEDQDLKNMIVDLVLRVETLLKKLEEKNE